MPRLARSIACAAAVLAAAPAFAADLPQYNIEAYCNAPERDAAFAGAECIDAESASAADVRDRWSEYTDAFLEGCLARSGGASYGALLDCLVSEATDADRR